MRTTTLILLGLAIVACAYKRVSNRNNPKASRPMKWWEMVLGVVAVLLAILVVMNPEFLALGLLGDTAFFDLLVLLLSLQLRDMIAQAWRCVAWVFSRVMRWAPRLSYMLVLSALVVVGSMVSAVQKFIHRISS